MPLESKAPWSERQKGESNTNWRGGWTLDPEQKKAYHRRYYQQNKNRARELKWRSRGAKCTLDDYEKVCIQQGNRCAICLKPPVEGKRLYVDHDHDTSQVRGLLCSHCNL